MTSYLRPTYSARTDTGRHRDHNEDYVYAGPVLVGAPGHPAWYVFVVAGGGGGHRGGEWASETAVSTLIQQLATRLEHTQPTEALRLAFQSTNAALWQET